jgi:hypothetical protein
LASGARDQLLDALEPHAAQFARDARLDAQRRHRHDRERGARGAGLDDVRPS